MARAEHHGGPMDGLAVRGVEQTQTRYYAPAAQRATSGWVELARYVFVPPRNGAQCVYRYTGVDHVRGPLPGDEDTPDWSTHL